MYEPRADESDLYMDMAGIDLPVPNTSDDSGHVYPNDGSFDSGRGSGSKSDRKKHSKKKDSPIKKMNLASGKVVETIADIHRSKSPEHGNITPFGDLAALKDTIEEQKVAIGILKDKLLDANVNGPRHRIGPRGNPLPIVSSHPRGAQRLLKDGEDSEEEEVLPTRCPIHDRHEPGCPVSGFVNLSLDETESLTVSESPPSPTKSPPKEAGQVLTVSILYVSFVLHLDPYRWIYMYITFVFMLLKVT